MAKKAQKSSIHNKEVALGPLIERIIKSGSFGKSATYANLFKFLIECTISGNIPKEATISAHLFGAEKSYQDSSQVRVYVYHLRKKLDQYFENEGKDEAYILSVPKGRYEVELTKRESSKPTLKVVDRKQVIVVMMIVLLIISISYNFYRGFFFTPEIHNESRGSFWADFISDDQPMLMAIGDLLIFSEKDKTSGKIRNVRVPEVNTDEQFDELQESFPDTTKELEKLSYTYLIRSSVSWVESLTRLMYPEKTFNTRMMSRVTAKDIHDHNIVFVGMQKTAAILNSYFSNSSVKLRYQGEGGYVIANDEENKFYSPHGDATGQHTDYGFIAKYPGPNNNTIFMFGGIWDTATTEALRMFTSEQKMQEVESFLIKEFSEVPPYFEMLIEVSGVDRVGFDTKIIYVNKINFSIETDE